MYGEAIQEISRDGKVVWEWLTYEHLDPEIDVIGPLHPRDRWTNLNSLSEMPDGNILVSFRCINTIAIIERASGRVAWRWGPGQIAGQHHPTRLENGNILLFDNGAHRPYTTIDYSRVIEIDPKSNDIVWEYKENPVFDFNSFICSGAQRMPGGTTVICECTKGRLFEVTHEGDIVWEYLSPFYYEHPIFGTNNMIFRCIRYDAAYPGLRGAIWTRGAISISTRLYRSASYAARAAARRCGRSTSAPSSRADTDSRSQTCDESSSRSSSRSSRPAHWPSRFRRGRSGSSSPIRRAARPTSWRESSAPSSARCGPRR